MQYVHNNHKTKQNAKPDKVNHALNFSIDWLASNPLYDCEKHMRAVQRRKRQDIKHRQIRRNQRDENQNVGHAL